MNKFLNLIAILSLVANFSSAMQYSEQQPNEMRRRISYRYLQWVNQVAEQEPSDTVPPDFISPDCTKTINGKTVAKNLKEIIAQMHKTKENFGWWHAYDFSVVGGDPLTEARFKFGTKSKKGIEVYVVSARFKFDYEKISEIEEIHALVENSDL